MIRPTKPAKSSHSHNDSPRKKASKYSSQQLSQSSLRGDYFEVVDDVEDEEENLGVEDSSVLIAQGDLYKDG